MKKAIQSKRRFRNNKIGFKSKFYINVPLSRETFRLKFEQKSDCFKMYGRDKLKVTVSVNDLRNVFGNDWNIHRQGKIQYRVKGMINLNYRLVYIP